MAEVSICILTWNSTKLLCDNLDSIFSYIKGIDFEIIVVDNGSVDNVSEVLKRRFPTVKLIHNEINKGVAVGRNQYLKRATGNFALLLDSDIYFRHNFLEILLNEIKLDPDVALAGPRILYPNGVLQYSCRRFPNPLVIIIRACRLEKKRLFKSFFKKYLMLDSDLQKNQEVNWVIGACQLVRREAWNDIELFDETYFFGYEDIDFCLRLKNKGWKILYLPEAEVIHYYQRISCCSINKFTFLHIRSVFYYFTKNIISKIPYRILKSQLLFFLKKLFSNI